MILLPYEKHFVDEIDALHAFEKLGSASTNSARTENAAIQAGGGNFAGFDPPVPETLVEKGVNSAFSFY